MMPCRWNIVASFGDIVAGDTKHILAWAKESNPRLSMKDGRFDPTRQAKSDPNCSLGTKKRRNRSPDADDELSTGAPAIPTSGAESPLYKVATPSAGAMPPASSPVSCRI